MATAAMAHDDDEVVKLPIIDLTAPDRLSTAASIRQACIEFGFFYVVNHGVDEDMMFPRLFDESRKFFSLPFEEKIKLPKKDHRGYTELYSEKLDTASESKGDPKESFYIGPLDAEVCFKNKWPSKELLPNWKPTMETYYMKILSVGKSLLSLIALALNLDEKFFEDVGALDAPLAFLRLLHYPDDTNDCNEGVLGSSAHSDYGMITLLATDGVPGLQVCREKDNQPRVWENVLHIEGALIVNVGDMIERWTNCLFRSTLHRVIRTGQERYSAAFFINPPGDLVVECLESCCSESNPPRFSPIRAMDYFRERSRLTYGGPTQLTSISSPT